MNDNQFLYIFEAGTIYANGVNRDIDPKIMALLTNLRTGPDNRFALVAHIPGVGERTAIKAKPKSKRADYNHLPLPGPTVKHYEKLGRVLFGRGQRNPVYLAFAYMDPTGQWGPNPPNLFAITSARWRHDWAPPAGEMLNQILTDAGILPTQALLIVSDPAPINWLLAAQAAGISAISIGNFYLMQEGKPSQ